MNHTAHGPWSAVPSQPAITQHGAGAQMPHRPTRKRRAIPENHSAPKMECLMKRRLGAVFRHQCTVSQEQEGPPNSITRTAL